MAGSILITGCSSGIGLASARALKARGWNVVASCRKAADVERLRAEGFLSVRIDYEEQGSIDAGFSEAMELLGGRLDALFNNGAYAIPAMVEDIPVEALRAIFEANFFGWHHLTRLALPVMRAQGAGRIVNCSSVLGFCPLPARGAYNATKFALEGLTATLRNELYGTGIHAILIEPGPIGTPFRANAAIQYRRWIQPLKAGSVWRDLYQNEMEPRLASDAPSRHELGPEAVAEKLIHAVESTRPRAVYRVTFPTHMMSLMKRILPLSAFDALCRKGR